MSGTSTGMAPAARTTPTESGQYGCGDDHLVSRLEHGAQRAEDGVRRPRADEHVSRRIGVGQAPSGRVEATREGSLQRLEAGDRAVPVERPVGLRGLDAAEARARRRRQVRVADVERDEIAAGARVRLDARRELGEHAGADGERAGGKFGHEEMVNHGS